MQTDNPRFGSRKFLLATVIITVAAAAMFMHLLTGSEFAALSSGTFTVFCGGDVALNAIYAKTQVSVSANQRAMHEASLKVERKDAPPPIKCAVNICTAPPMPGEDFCGYHLRAKL